MKILYPTLACFLHTCLGGCLDYVKIEEESVINESFSFPPTINIGGLYPPPARLTEPVSVGKNCKGQVFKVPPIVDRNAKDRLYYLWFLDNKLAWPQSTIEPEFRKDAIIRLDIDEQFLISLFDTKIPKDFFNRSHIIEFIVSNVPYAIPESKYIDEDNANEKNHGDYAYWIITFSNEDC